jgi:SpoVK/Ycf46/Vps4 family AAA+-type ATPase
MNNIVEFVKSKNLKKHNIYENLKCDIEEVNILQYLTKQYINGVTNQVCIDILGNFYNTKEFEHLEKIDLIKNLLGLGWIEQVNLSSSKISELSNLEIINTTVCLSSTFLKLLELGNLNIVLPKITPYNDQLEYLQDQFNKISLTLKLSHLKYDFKKDSPNINNLELKLEKIQNVISKRLKVTKESIAIEDFFDENKLNKEEQTIFLALLKEEYGNSDESIRDMNSLLSLISNDDFEKIKHRTLLEESGTLISNGIIDYDEILTPFGAITRNYYILDTILYKISHPNTKPKRKAKIKLDTIIKEQKLFELIEPKKSLDDLILNEKTNTTLNTLLKQVDKEVINKLKLWGIKDKKKGIDARIIFYGSAGTGKTATALALAKELKKQILSFDCSKILSMYIGESEKNVRAIFDNYKDICKQTKSEPILLLNEADQFLSNRVEGNTSSSDKMHNQMQNIFLEQIENFDGILIATTNLLDSIDKAFSRRFNYKIEFLKPSLEQREKLWKKLIPPKLPLVENFDYSKLISYSLTGGQIELIIKNTAYRVASSTSLVFNESIFIEEINKEINNKFDNETKVGFF